MSTIYALFLAFISGSLMAWQGSINSLLERRISPMPATLVVHVIGSATALLVVLAIHYTGGEQIEIKGLVSAPWHAYLGGIISVAIIFAVAVSISQAGAAHAATAIIVGQVLTATLIDHLGLFDLRQVSFSSARLLGVTLLAAGAYLLLKNI